MVGKLKAAIDEGTAIALAAARLALKNEILVETIAGDASFETERFVPNARKVLSGLAKEAERDASRLKRLGRKAWAKYSQSDGTHDYRDRDVRNLRRRRKQSAGVAAALRAVAGDKAEVNDLVEQAREAAWDDVRANIDRRLRVEGMRPDSDPDYEKMRDARMQALMMVDLQNLKAQVAARARVNS
ncbi:hypothetical protein [Microbacterium gorillae]|uniref:hypothetical protein n=1 Tax=Microbacterium gorillae TaxID=1231063 RepID=UPI000693F670|nr:hypothetical protein [Microbacterium gorillae]